jgi:superfamily II DNA or RNA helicase
MRVTIDTAVRVPLGELPPDVADELRERFSHDNPAYWDARRNRRPCRHLPRRLTSFDETPTELLLPRGALPELLAGPLAPLDPIVDDRTALPPRSALTFSGVLRDYQQAAVEACLAHANGVVVAPTGSGKTVVALALVARLATPALILVHTNVLLRQSAERVRSFLGVEPAVYAGARREVGDVTLATVQCLQRQGATDLAGRFGLVLLDEAHHGPAASFRTVLASFAARYRIGLTATPERKDRLHPLLFDVVGPIVSTIGKPALEESLAILRPSLIAVETGFGFFYRRNWASLVTSLTRNAARNAVVIDAVLAHHRARSLVTTERIEHAELLAERLATRLPGRVACVHGQMPRDQIDQRLAALAEGTLQVIVATTSLVGEGFDLPDLDTLFVTVPHGNPAKAAQLLGRILRPSPGKLAPRVVDFLDARVPILRSQWSKRKKVYEGEPPNPAPHD